MGLRKNARMVLEQIANLWSRKRPVGSIPSSSAKRHVSYEIHIRYEELDLNLWYMSHEPFDPVKKPGAILLYQIKKEKIFESQESW